ncbi:hypothetical protein SISSUDRAFT_980232 [Sistotremastrum suecicum HHB10207 ss-3]|uniref:CCR4-Not complex 3'-5'-exoribonuclease subunit Ccr4 n=1 Tax=Sistotremastrum suecicum HHB10207 ss-3 TaxID=1314776 RepID=A0A166HAK0_9AGAM|nr:hypothetical protein SISSUDRAFT_980232 [Sistotremastrum suecicum HHB10207 ss-3]
MPTPYPGPAQQDPHLLRSASPSTASVASQVVNPHWQQQIIKAEVSRASASPHHRARASAMATRNSTKSAIPITDPNRAQKQQDGENSDSASPEPSHPSSTAAPVQTKQASASPSWSTLDIGGMRVQNISLSLFKFTYLTALYLNHNRIAVIPPEIATLRSLQLLDLSGNSLLQVPPELGMLTSLRELYLFDNHITTLPLELGTLHQLNLLGVEGNPLDNHLRTLIQKDGTQALISFLRDSCPVPASPPERNWVYLQSEAERRAAENDPTSESFSLLSYNILCDRCATPNLYGYTPSWALSWEYRKGLILQEIQSYDADFLCLQEVDIAQYEDYFTLRLTAQEYEGVFWPKFRARTMGEAERRRVDGCAIFYKSSKYQLVEKQFLEFSQIALQRPDFKKNDDMFNRVLTKDNIAVVATFEHRISGSRLVVANVHVHWDPEYSDVKLVQVGLMMDEVDKIANRFAKLPPRPAPTPKEGDPPDSTPPPTPPTYSDGSKIPTIVCGDFNSVPDSGVYQYLANGSLSPSHPDFMSHVYGSYTTDGMKHRFGLRSAYAGIGELPMTNYTTSFNDVIDYIWYSTNTLNVTSLLGEIDQGYLSKVVGFPHPHFPSDHICILSEFRVKPPKDNAPNNRPPVFHPSSSR